MPMTPEDFNALRTYDLVKLEQMTLAEKYAVLKTAVNLPDAEGVETEVHRFDRQLGPLTNENAVVVLRVEKPASQTAICRCGHSYEEHDKEVRRPACALCAEGEVACPVFVSAFKLQATIRSITGMSEGTFRSRSRELIELRDGDPVVVFLARESLLPLEADERLATRERLNGLDEIAIRNPHFFIQARCGLRWLPTHSGARGSVRDRIDRTHRMAPGDQITDDAMRSVLEYRMWITQRLQEQVIAAALHYSRAARLQYAIAQGATSVDAQAFSLKAKPMGGDIPGSTELSSDIDINTFGDGTEFAVREFNALFRPMFGGKEAGIVFDVNIYAKDFLPNMGKKGFWQRTGTPKPAAENIRPEFDYAFRGRTWEDLDALYQLSHGLTKLRRYMVNLPPPVDGDQERDWRAFCGGLEGIEELAADLRKARNRHLEYNHWIYQLSAPRSSIPAVPLLQPLSEIGEGPALTSEREMGGRDSSKVMEAQNRLYEYFLKTKVEPLRMNFLYQKQLNEADLDHRFAALRTAISESLYFANEAYVTCGGVLHVVGGKQQKSRKVGDDYTGKISLHNIAYTVHELMQSAVDQLADIHKEAHRDFPADGSASADQLSATVLATGKYIHRLMNALKHMYRILNEIAATGEGAGKPFPELFPAAACPIAGEAEPRRNWWRDMTNFAFGLEALKKTDLLRGQTKVEQLLALSLENYQNVQNKRPDVPDKFEKGTASILVHKFRFSYDDLGLLFPGRVLGEYTKPRILLFAAGRAQVTLRAGGNRSLYAPDRGVDNHQADYYSFFNAFVQYALVDYLRYLGLLDTQLGPWFTPGAKRPFCLAGHFIVTSATGRGTKELWPGHPPVPALLAAAPRAGMALGDDDDELEYEEEEGS